MKLSLRQRAAIVMRFYLGLSEAETADLIGCAPGTVKSLLHRGISRLREDLALTAELDEVAHD
jgi:RNA polymerase sigma factor (sigma-70 family)